MADHDDSTFIDDIVISGATPRPKLLTHAELLKLPDVGDNLLPVVNNLLQRGVVVAAIPSISGIGAACYLLNLASMKKPGG